ncbi:hypothetical protein [Ascidiimonas aurantiaca]|uniref:hypothetical protein n=1 Tax=Ascidiimonas aurantiaca TaxID=1685432 RepID=UPI0030EE5D4D
MKKRYLKKLNLNKTSISNLEKSVVKGGLTPDFTGDRTCPQPLVETINITFCWGGMICEIRDNGC